MSTPSTVHVAFPGRLVIVGFGSIGQGVLPLILRHIGIARERIAVVAGDERGRAVAEKEGVAYHVQLLTPENYRDVLEPLLGEGDFLLNLSVNVSSLSLIGWCRERGALYLDTCVEPWEGGYADPGLSFTERSNFGLREKALALRDAQGPGPTAVITHGANPGIVSHFLKRALLRIARDTGHAAAAPTRREEWAALARDLGVKTIHVAEYDTQVAATPKKIGRFENTWSVDGFYSEGVTQPAELGWGTHERRMPADARRHEPRRESPIYLERPGAATLVRTWTPARGTFAGRLVTHHESIAIADYLTCREGEAETYRPTVHYAYRPCDAAMLSLEESLGGGRVLQREQKILVDDIDSGMDELGVLVMGHGKGAYWYGSQLTIEEARRLAPYQNATGLQVTAGVLGAMVWAIEHPREGLVEADDLDHERVMEIIEPYLGTMAGAYTDWTPLAGRDGLFPEEADRLDPWQFTNFRMA